MGLRTKVIALIVGGLFVVSLMVTTPILLGAVKWATAAPPIAPEAVCAHFSTDLKIDVPDCPTWVAEQASLMDPQQEAYKACALAAKTVDDAKACESFDHLRRIAK